MIGIGEIAVARMRRLVYGEDGVVMALSLAFMLPIFILTICIFAVQETLVRKVELQNAADSAAYSAAVVESDYFSRIAMVNQVLGWAYVDRERARADCAMAMLVKQAPPHYEPDREQCRGFNSATCCDKTKKEHLFYGIGSMNTHAITTPDTIAACNRITTMPTLDKVKGTARNCDSIINAAKSRINSDGTLITRCRKTLERLETEHDRAVARAANDMLRLNLNPLGINWYSQVYTPESKNIIEPLKCCKEDEQLLLEAAGFEDCDEEKVFGRGAGKWLVRGQDIYGIPGPWWYGRRSVDMMEIYHMARWKALAMILGTVGAAIIALPAVLIVLHKAASTEAAARRNDELWLRDDYVETHEATKTKISKDNPKKSFWERLKDGFDKFIHGFTDPRYWAQKFQDFKNYWTFDGSTNPSDDYRINYSLNGCYCDKNDGPCRVLNFDGDNYLSLEYAMFAKRYWRLGFFKRHFCMPPIYVPRFFSKKKLFSMGAHRVCVRRVTVYGKEYLPGRKIRTGKPIYGEPIGAKGRKLSSGFFSRAGSVRIMVARDNPNPLRVFGELKKDIKIHVRDPIFKKLREVKLPSAIVEELLAYDAGGIYQIFNSHIYDEGLENGKFQGSQRPDMMWAVAAARVGVRAAANDADANAGTLAYNLRKPQTTRAGAKYSWNLTRTDWEPFLVPFRAANCDGWDTTGDLSRTGGFFDKIKDKINFGAAMRGATFGPLKIPGVPELKLVGWTRHKPTVVNGRVDGWSEWVMGSGTSHVKDDASKLLRMNDLRGPLPFEKGATQLLWGQAESYIRH